MTIEDIESCFSMNLVDAAKSLGVCRTALKRICRMYGIKRWPHRRIKSLTSMVGRLNSKVAATPTPLVVSARDVSGRVVERIARRSDGARVMLRGGGPEQSCVFGSGVTG